MNKFQRITLSAFTIAALSGCAIPDNYVNPTDGPRSKVRFVDAQWVGYVDIAKYDEPDCSPWKTTRMFRLFPSGVNPQNPPHENLGLPLNTYDEVQYREIYIPTDKPLVLFANSYGDVILNACQVHFYYPFEDGHDYEVKYTPKPPQDCEVTLSEFVYDSSAPRLVELKTYPGDLFGSFKDKEGCVN